MKLSPFSWSVSFVVTCAALAVGASASAAPKRTALEVSKAFFDTYVQSEKISDRDLRNAWHLLKKDILALDDERYARGVALASQFEAIDTSGARWGNLPKLMAGDILSVSHGKGENGRSNWSHVLVLSSGVRANGVASVSVARSLMNRADALPNVELDKKIDLINDQNFKPWDLRECGRSLVILRPRKKAVESGQIAISDTDISAVGGYPYSDQEQLNKALFTESEFKMSKVRELVSAGSDLNSTREGKPFLFATMEVMIEQGVALEKGEQLEEEITLEDLYWIMDQKKIDTSSKAFPVRLFGKRLSINDALDEMTEYYRSPRIGDSSRAAYFHQLLLEY